MGAGGGGNGGAAALCCSTDFGVSVLESSALGGSGFGGSAFGGSDFGGSGSSSCFTSSTSTGCVSDCSDTRRSASTMTPNNPRCTNTEASSTAVENVRRDRIGGNGSSASQQSYLTVSTGAS